MIEKGKELCEDLVANVKEQYEEFKSRPPRQHGGYGGHGGYGDRGHSDRHGDRGHHGDRGGYGDRGYGDRGYGDRGHGDRGRSSSQGGSYGYGAGRYGSEGASNSPAPPGVNSPATATTADYAAQYAQYYGGQDPYAAWGGYAKYVFHTCPHFPSPMTDSCTQLCRALPAILWSPGTAGSGPGPGCSWRPWRPWSVFVASSATERGSSSAPSASQLCSSTSSAVRVAARHRWLQ